MLGLCGALALLAAFEFLVARDPGLWTADPRSKTGLHQVMIDEVVPAHRDARVVFLGDSCVRDAFDPVQIERKLGLRRGQVLNLGVTGGTPYDCERLWLRARPQLEGPDVVVLGLEDHHFGAREVTDVERKDASLDERLHDFEGDARLGLLVSAVWRTFAARDLLEKRLLTAVRGTDRSLPIGEDGRVVWRTAAEVQDFGPAVHEAEPRLTELFGPMRALAESTGSPIAHLSSRPIHRLIRAILDDEHPIRLMIIRLPRRPSFEAASQSVYPDEYQAARQALEDLQAGHPRVLVIDGARHRWAFGDLGETDFYDWGHATGSGAWKLGRQIVKFVRRFAPGLQGIPNDPWADDPWADDPWADVPRPGPPR